MRNVSSRSEPNARTPLCPLDMWSILLIAAPLLLMPEMPAPFVWLGENSRDGDPASATLGCSSAAGCHNWEICCDGRWWLSHRRLVFLVPIPAERVVAHTDSALWCEHAR